jgi:hypothetical protein
MSLETDMHKIAAYQIALENIEIEKRAEYLVDTYGTCDGYMPAAYLQAFDDLEKGAGLQTISNLGSRLSTAARNTITGMKGSGAVVRKGGKMQLGRKAGLGDTAKYYGARGLQSAGRFAMENPGTTAGIAGLGTAGAAGLGYKALK